MADKEPKKIVPIHPSRMFQTETRVRELMFIAEAKTEPEDCLDAAYWGHVAAQLQEYTRLEVFCEDWSWYAEFRVVESGANWAKVVLMHEKRFGKHAPSGAASYVLPGHSIGYAGSFAKWRVVRDIDKAVLKDKLATKADAEQWLAEFSKVSQAEQAA